MSYEHKDGSFTLFPNDKGGNDKRPDYRGEGKDLSGHAIEVAGWVRRGTQGKEFISCTIKQKQAAWQKREDVAPKQEGPNYENEKVSSTRKRGPAALDGMGDDIPFAPTGRGISGHAR